MTTLNTQTFDQIVQTEAAAVQGGSSGNLVDFTVGSIMRAIVEAFAGVIMWLQALILQLLVTTRAATSTATYLDTWMADFGLTRLAAVAATGSVTFSRFTPTNQATISVGSVVQTADGTAQFTVIADTTQASYSSSLGAYVIPAGTVSITASVQAVTAGSAGNVASGSVTALGQSISGVDTVTNGAAFINGADAEEDAPFRARFINYISSLFRATKAAVGYSISALQQTYTYSITECQDTAGNAKAGYFFVTLNDGTGSPTSSELATATTAVDAVRACGIQFTVVSPLTLSVGVTATVIAATGYTHAAVAAAVQTAITAYIQSISIGGTVSFSRLYAVIYGVSGVSSVTALAVNGATSDIPLTARQVATVGAISVS